MIEVQDEHELLRQVMETREAADLADAKLKTLREEMTSAELKLLDYLERRDLKGYKSDLVGASVERRETLRVRIMKDNEDKAFAFIDEELGRGDVIKTKKDIHWKTLSSIIADLQKKGEQFPQELFETYWQKSLAITKN